MTADAQRTDFLPTVTNMLAQECDHHKAEQIGPQAI